MEFIMENAKNKVQALSDLLQRVSKPNPKHIKDPIEYEFTLQQNKTFIMTHFFLIITFWGSYIVFGGPLKLICSRNLCCVVLLLVHYYSIKHNPSVFKAFYAVACLLYGISAGYIQPQGIGITYISVHLLPIFVYVFTGSLWLTLFDFAVFVSFQNLYFKDLVTDAIYNLSTDQFAEALIYGSNVKTVLLIALIVITHYFYKNASYRIYITEKRKNEIENQKIFLMSFSHELRNLINSLTGNVKLVSFEPLNTRCRELLLNAEVCGELLLHLVNNILDTGKVEIGELEINPMPTKVYDTLERIWGICSELIRRKNFKGHLKIQNNIPKNLMIDHYRITQIFLNLVGNAIKFTERGHINIQVKWLSDRARVDEQCWKPYPFNDEDEHDEGLFEKDQMFCLLNKDSFNLNAAYKKIQTNMLHEPESYNRGVLKVIVRDTGSGMTKEELGKLFNKFTQVTSDISKKKLGTGLGLFITKQLCQRVGGDIRAYSKKGKGSAFIFCLPVNCADNNIEMLNDVEDIKRLFSECGLRTMIVEDEPLLHMILGNFFNKLNIKVSDIAVNGLEAFHKYSQLISKHRNRPNIVTMDLDMPIMDGKEAARKIRQLETDGKIRPCFLLIISGNCTESEINECLDKKGTIRADAFLKKPINIEDLLRIIRCNINQLISIG